MTARSVPAQAGFTLLEMTIVIAIIAIIFALILPVSRQFQVNTLLVSEAAQLAADLRRAYAAAVAGEYDLPHGVHVDATPTDQWVRFRGTPYTAGAPENVVHVLPSSLDITDVTLAGGGQDILFAERRGTTANTGSVTLRAPNGETRTVSVNDRGVVEIE